MELFHSLFGLIFCIVQNHSIYYFVQEFMLLNGHHCLFIHNIMDAMVDHSVDGVFRACLSLVNILRNA
jgi:hypothetical protein